MTQKKERSTMAEFRWIKVSLFLCLVLQFTEVTGQHYLSFIVREGDDATLPCENVIDDQNNCDGTTWAAISGGRTEDLVTLGQIGEITRSDRLSVTENCSLVIKRVTDDDAGRYDCRQFKSGIHTGEDKLVFLSVVHMKACEDGEKVTLSCSTSSDIRCRHTVKWLCEGENEDEFTKNAQTSHFDCSDSEELPTLNLKQKPTCKCKVMDGFTQKVQVFSFSPQSSGEDATVIRTTESSTQSRTTSTAPAISITSTAPPSWWLYVSVAVGLVALLIITAAVIRWKRTKGKKTQMDDNIGQSLCPTVAQPGPDMRQYMADPEDGVSYASISYTKNTTSKVQVKYNDEEGDAVTYSTVKASSSSYTGASADPSDLYASINKSKK